ncbi:MAG: SRPBCC family protein [Alphaproteobacteria bacterium]
MAKVYVSGVIDLPVDRVWALARDFNGHHSWHPIIADSHIEDGWPSDRVGCIRNFRLADGTPLREQLLSFSDLDHSFTYNILESPLPLKNYVATFRCTPVTEGDRTFVEWMAEFDVAPEHEADLKQQVGRNTFAAGIQALAKALGA